MNNGLCVKIPEEFNIIDPCFSEREVDKLFFTGNSTRLYKGKEFKYDKNVFYTFAMCAETIVEQYGNSLLKEFITNDLISLYVNLCLSEENKEFYKQHNSVLYKKSYLYNNTLYILSDIEVTHFTSPFADKITVFDNYKISIHDFQKILDLFINTQPYGNEKYKQILITITNEQNNKKFTYIINFDEIKSYIPDCVVCGSHNWNCSYTSNPAPHFFVCEECGYMFNSINRFMYTIKRKNSILKERKEGNK